jgi:uncharacterized protein YjbI with pentapeptide repeats
MLNEADLREANLSGAKLSETQLSGAEIFGAKFSGADLRGADLGSVSGLDQTQLNEARGDPENCCVPDFRISVQLRYV